MVYFWQGQVLFVDGEVAMTEDCCCVGLCRHCHNLVDQLYVIFGGTTYCLEFQPQFGASLCAWRWESGWDWMEVYLGGNPGPGDPHLHASIGGNEYLGWPTDASCAAFDEDGVLLDNWDDQPPRSPPPPGDITVHNGPCPASMRVQSIMRSPEAQQELKLKCLECEFWDKKKIGCKKMCGCARKQRTEELWKSGKCPKGFW